MRISPISLHAYITRFTSCVYHPFHFMCIVAGFFLSKSYLPIMINYRCIFI